MDAVAVAVAEASGEKPAEADDEDSVARRADALLTQWTAAPREKRALLLAGGYAAVAVDGLREHADMARVAAPTCALLAAICGEPEGPVIVWAAGGVPVVVEAMQNHTEDSAVQLCGCTVLATAVTTEAQRESAVGFGGLSVLLRKMQARLQRGVASAEVCTAREWRSLCRCFCHPNVA